MEAGEGGGAATIRKLDIPMYVPKNYSDLYKLLGMLRNDKSIGGVVVDSATEMNSQYIKPESLKYPSRENSPTRLIGVSTRSDYQVMGELMSSVLRMLMGLTTHENPEYRKHLVVTAADMTREEDEKINWIGPALPGRMSREATQMFQQVFTMEVKPELVDGKRTLVRYLVTQGDGVRALKDRYGILPERLRLKASATDPLGEDLATLWEKYYIENMTK